MHSSQQRTLVGFSTALLAHSNERLVGSGCPSGSREIQCDAVRPCEFVLHIEAVRPLHRGIHLLLKMGNGARAHDLGLRARHIIDGETYVVDSGVARRAPTMELMS